MVHRRLPIENCRSDVYNRCFAKLLSGKQPFCEGREAILRSWKNHRFANKRFTKQGPNQHKAKIPHRKHRFAIAIVIAKKSSSSNFIISWGKRLARHHCILYPVFSVISSPTCPRRGERECEIKLMKQPKLRTILYLQYNQFFMTYNVWIFLTHPEA